MVAPGATGASFDVLLQFSLDPAANERVTKGVTTIDQELKRIEQDAQKAGKAVSTALDATSQKANVAIKSVASLGVELAKLSERSRKGVSQLGQDMEKVTKAQLTWTEFVKQKMGPEMKVAMQSGLGHAEAHKVAINKIAQEWKQYKAEASTALRTVQVEETKATQVAISHVQALKQIEQQAKKARQEAAIASSAAARAIPIFAQGLVLGGGIVGGALAEAGRFAKEEQQANRATEATRQWTAATLELSQARRRVDTVLLREALPLLQQAAKVATQAASIVEKHPELVAAGLKAGVIIAEVSAIGLAVSKGIKLVADVKYIAATATELIAAKLHDQAANKELAAASKGLITNRADDLRKALGVGGASGGLASQTGLAGAITSPVGIGSLIVGFAAANVAVQKNLNDLEKVLNAKAKGLGTIVTDIAASIATAVPGGQLVQPLREIGKAAERDIPLIQGLIQKILGIGQASSQTRGSVGGRTPETDAIARVSSDTMEQALKIYEDYRKDDLALVQQHYTDRQNIVSDALAQEQSANEKYAQSIARVNEQEASSLANAAADFAQANARAEQQYQDQRAQIIRDGNEQIQQIEADSKERLRKLEEDYLEQRSDVLGRRDALALSKLDNQHIRDVAEEKRQTQQEVRQRRQEIAQRLADLAQSYEQERSQRQADYAARVAEIHANAQQQLQELQAEHAAELQQIEQQKAAKLRELDAQFLAERQRRYQYFIAQIRDLDATLLGETQLRQQYQQRMLSDLNNFLEAYRAGLASLSNSVPTGTVGTRAFGGYASYGMYKLGDSPSGGPGPEEYVIRGLNTRALEQAIGGKINDQILLSAVRQFVSGRSSTYVDNRRIDGSASKWSKRDMQQAAMDAIASLIG